MKILNIVIPILMHYNIFLQNDSENLLCYAYTSSGCQLHKTACQLHIFTCQRKATLCNDVGFATVYRRIYCCKFMTLSNQTSRCICKCIRMTFHVQMATVVSASRQQPTEIWQAFLKAYTRFISLAFVPTAGPK